MESTYLSRVASQVANLTDKAKAFENVYFSRSVEPSVLSKIWLFFSVVLFLENKSTHILLNT